MKAQKIIGALTLLIAFPLLIGILILQSWSDSDSQLSWLAVGIITTGFIKGFLGIPCGILLMQGKRLGYKLGVFVWGYTLAVNCFGLFSSLTDDAYQISSSLAIIAIGNVLSGLIVSSIIVFILVKNLMQEAASSQNDEKQSRALKQNIFHLSPQAITAWGAYIVLTAFILFVYPLMLKESESQQHSLSTDIHWQPLILPPASGDTNRYNDVIWDGSRFLLSGDDDFFMSSIDGVNWTDIDSGVDSSIKALAHNNNTYVAQLWSGIITSVDGVCWKEVKLEGRHFSNIIQNEAYFYLASTNKVYRSDDGLSWEVIAESAFEREPNLIWNGAGIVAYNDYEKWFSKDGRHWDKLSELHMTYPIFLDDNIYSSASTARIYKSSAQINELFLTRISNDKEGGDTKVEWETVLNPASSSIIGTTDGLSLVNGYLFAFGDHISWSKDGAQWSSIELPNESRGWIKKVVYGNDNYVAIGNSGLLMVGTSKEVFTIFEDEIKNINKKTVLKIERDKSLKNMKLDSDQLSLKQKIDLYNYPNGFFPLDLKKHDTFIATSSIKADKSLPISKPKTAKEMLYIILEPFPDMDIHGLLEKEREEQTDSAEKWIAINILQKKELLTWYDAEAGTYPVPYDWLVSEYSNLAEKYGITIDNISMELIKNSCGNKQNYKISWQLNNVTYGVEFHDDSDWFSGPVESGLNTSLQEQGYKERFISLDSGDQTAIYVLADPEVLEASGLYEKRL